MELTIFPRSFASFSDFVSITEGHSASAQTTDYPIENGTQGTDHVVVQPDSLTWELAWPESHDGAKTYDRLHKLLESGEPFDAFTGLKSYSNMVLLGISASQDSHTGRILKCVLTMREIKITSPQTTTVQGATSITQSGKKQTSTASAKVADQADTATQRESDLHKMAGKSFTELTS